MAEREECRVLHIDWERRSLGKVEILAPQDDSHIPAQQEVFDRLYRANEKISVAFITHGCPDLKLPDSIRTMGTAKLRWGQMFDIPEFGYDEGGIFGTITARSIQSYIYIPWSAVYEISTDSGAGPFKWPENCK